MINKYNILNKIKKRSTDIRDNTQDARLTVALVGNPNSGKTTLFNNLTGDNQKVGNWPGVTVERKMGACKLDSTIAIVDTPGIYSLTPFTQEETVARNYLQTGYADVIVNVVDSTNLQRNLYLTTQLIELGTPVVVALNMQDEAQAKGISIDSATLERLFGCKFVAISAAKNLGINALIDTCKQTHDENKCDDTSNTSKTTRKLTTNNQRNATTQCLTGCDTHTSLHWTPQTNSQVKTEPPRKLTTAKERYDFIDQALQQAQTIHPSVAKHGKTALTDKIDRIVLNKWLAFPIFAAVMTLVFYLSVGSVGSMLTGLINNTITPAMQQLVTNWMVHSAPPWLTSLLVDGIIGGVMSVVGFLPQIMLLFGCIALLEASGYMSRIAFITDKLLHKIGLGGRSFVSMILGCGCSVPAIMSTRTIRSANERNATITLTPFMPCSAKLAVIAFFTSYLLGGNALFAISFYFVSILAVIAGGLILKLLSRKQNDADNVFIMELPPYRLPTLGNVWKQMRDRGKAFLIKAGTVIFVASVALWLATNFNFRFQMVETEDSILASIGKLIAPIFTPLGFNDGGYGWQYSVATLTGIAAKETVVTTLNILLPQGISGTISGLGAYSYVTYNLLTVPCVATISASFAEQGGRSGIKTLLFQLCAAYAVSLAIYQLGTLAKHHTTAFTVTVVSVVVLSALVIATRHIVTHRKCCATCHDCAMKNSCNK